MQKPIPINFRLNSVQFDRASVATLAKNAEYASSCLSTAGKVKELSFSCTTELSEDHAGHIFGVDSSPMISKLEQYNEILKKVVEVLDSQSSPGDLHENTMLLVMGDHGQTLNGDHGGGSAEEVETSIFALSMKKPPISAPAAFDNSTCQLDMQGRRICFSSIQQLDFAATVSALLGLPFPFGSIGHVNSELFALAAGTWSREKLAIRDQQSLSELNEWMQNYVNVLCINSWQVMNKLVFVSP
ncbi:Alkaline-phosphatase-like family protein [Abeliophyllum distichum]|uniref:Alkaline-phosphatase-like family protein n=1 Tax=Abeliophyllum distichum TaxID=126358 RepID=A0ABD1T2A4_9LAMI